MNSHVLSDTSEKPSSPRTVIVVSRATSGSPCMTIPKPVTTPKRGVADPAVRSPGHRPQANAVGPDPEPDDQDDPLAEVHLPEAHPEESSIKAGSGLWFPTRPNV
jgi:hypothetical protein